MEQASRQRFHGKIDRLKEDTKAMARATETMISQSIGALLVRDETAIDSIIKQDDPVDQFNRDIERHAIQLLATQQPMATDLRLIAGILKIITDIERLGDYSVDIAKSITDLTRKPSEKSARLLTRMQDTSIAMVQQCLTSFDTKDTSHLPEVIEMDSMVDAHYSALQEHVVTKLESKSSDNHGRHEMAVLLAGRYLERIADHITNICERVQYIYSGEWHEAHTD